jgi:hypothetical protein
LRLNISIWNLCDLIFSPIASPSLPFATISYKSVSSILGCLCFCQVMVNLIVGFPIWRCPWMLLYWNVVLMSLRFLDVANTLTQLSLFLSYKLHSQLLV